ncbi:hypothetical protein [Prochlorococcus sp. MIT 1307]|uniref:hypothetical protein n=1 Tax=Prochlorococcus sp. MIT 1307 TaxID=3096219 RepID=UPI002A761EBE|nr:hypothetical protein [Prochlorococcus sp. MIT 1307]
MKTESIPLHLVLKKSKQVFFHIPGGFPANMEIPTWIKSFPAGYKGIVERCQKTFYRLRAGANL